MHCSHTARVKAHGCDLSAGNIQALKTPRAGSWELLGVYVKGITGQAPRHVCMKMLIEVFFKVKVATNVNQL